MGFELNFASYAILGTGLFLVISGILIKIGARAADRQDEKRQDQKGHCS